MIREDESYLYNVLKKYSKIGEWKFTEFKNEKGEDIPQSKYYSDDNLWCAWPDFEYFNNGKLSLLVELKCYDGYFGKRDYVVAMKKRHFRSYLTINKKEKVDVRVCFALIFDTQYSLYWENIQNMDKMKSKTIMPYTQTQYNYVKKIWEDVTEDYVFWYITEFRIDYQNLPN